MEELRERLAEIADLERVSMLLAWDQEVCMPPAGGEARGEMRATVGRLAHERFTDERVGALLAEAAPRDELEADIVRVARRDFDKAVRVPGELVAEMARAGVAARGAWMQAREANDFAPFAPYLERNIELRRRYSACFPEAEHPYDPLLDDYEPGMTHRRGARRARAPARRPGAARGLGAPDRRRRAARRPVPRGRPARAAGHRAARHRRRRGAVAPGRGDAPVRGDHRRDGRAADDALRRGRHATRCTRSLHEFGHGLYEHQVDPALERTPLAGGASSAWHESQSRLWENMVGRSGGFWRWCLPHAQAALPERFAGVTWQEVQRAANAVRPSFIRVAPTRSPTGCTSPCASSSSSRSSRATWRWPTCPRRGTSACSAYLGLDVPDDVHGVLQDIHWAEGAFGYFPTYAVGNVIAGQVWARVTAELPDLDERFAAGDFAPLREWLAENVHRFGRRHLTTEMLERVVGGGLDPAPYLAYLEAKIDASAQLMS